MSSDLLHAIATGLLVGTVFQAVKHFGFLEGRSRLQTFLILVPILFVTVFVLNLLWPDGAGGAG